MHRTWIRHGSSLNYPGGAEAATSRRAHVRSRAMSDLPCFRAAVLLLDLLTSTKRSYHLRNDWGRLLNHIMDVSILLRSAPANRGLLSPLGIRSLAEGLAPRRVVMALRLKLVQDARQREHVFSRLQVRFSRLVALRRVVPLVPDDRRGSLQRVGPTATTRDAQ